MLTKIIVFSQSNNTLNAARDIKKGIKKTGQCEILNILKYGHDSLKGADLIGIAFPIFLL